MTPIELLDDVKSRFSVLLYDDETALMSLLKKALLTYQDRAGFICRRRIAGGDSFELPDDFLARIVVNDFYGQFIQSTPWIEENEMELSLCGSETPPYTLIYMIDSQKKPMDEWQIPSQAYGLIADYLEILIAIPNSERMARVAAAGKMDISNLPAFADLNAKKTEIELAISSNRAVIPVMGIIG